jgi:hypothetical protein
MSCPVVFLDAPGARGLSRGGRHVRREVQLEAGQLQCNFHDKSSSFERFESGETPRPPTYVMGRSGVPRVLGSGVHRQGGRDQGQGQGRLGHRTDLEQDEVTINYGASTNPILVFSFVWQTCLRTLVPRRGHGTSQRRLTTFPVAQIQTRDERKRKLSAIYL